MPSYPGGLKCLDKLFAENFNSYIISKIIKPFGQLNISFFIDEQGAPSNIHIDKEVQDDLLRLIKYTFVKMDTWTPAIQNGKNIGVNVTYTLLYND